MQLFVSGNIVLLYCTAILKGKLFRVETITKDL
jgi:hypothetical protein